MNDSGELPYAVVELGLADETLHRTLQPGEAMELPEILIQSLPQGQPHLAAPVLHRYLSKHHFADAKPQAPVVYNTLMEPERFGPEAPIRAEHPEWFVPVGAAARMDLTQPAAYAWLRAEIARPVETYQLAWMKIDFNFALDADASGAELSDYTAAW